MPNYNYHPLVPANKLQRKLKQQESTAGVVGSSVPVAQLFEVGKRDQWVDGQYYRSPPPSPPPPHQPGGIFVTPGGLMGVPRPFRNVLSLFNREVQFN